MAEGKIRVAVVGLGFGAEFVPIYLDHPDVASVAICDQQPERLQKVAERFGIRQCHSRLEDVLAGEVDAVHLVSGIPDHAQQALAVLESGLHCACTVPMAISIEDLRGIVSAQRKTGRNYMMMETAVYTRQFLYAKDLLARGEFGRIQFLRGAHYQDMECWPPYWAGLPPMYYATHAVAPLLALAGCRATKVHCLGSGWMRESLHAQYGNSFPVETAIFQLESSGLAAEVTRTLFHCARDYMESFVVYGENACLEWQMEKDSPVLFRMEPWQPDRTRPCTNRRIEAPDRQDLLPGPIARYTRSFVYEAGHSHLSFKQGGGHHGSHPHLVHEFVRSIVEGRQPWIDAVTAANWTAAGICAHESAMKGGAAVEIPSFC